MAMLKFHDEAEMRKVGIVIDPCDSGTAVPIGQLADRQQAKTPAEGVPVDAGDGQDEPERNGTPVPVDTPEMKTEISQPKEADSPQSMESFARETSSVAVGDVSNWDNDALLVGMEREWAALRTLEAPFPGRYHRLGTFVKEFRERLNEEDMKRLLRQEGIDSTRAWRAEQIARLYTYDQAVAFPSLRQILRTIPSKQPRKPKPKAGLAGSGDHCDHGQQKQPEKPRPEVDEESILDSFIQLGIDVREQLGDEALDNAVEQIKAHVTETFEEAFEEVC
jgi:hypothetical protein